MKKKTSKTVASDSALPTQLRESAQQIWTAGVGAIAKAQQGGNRVFEALVKDGGSIRSLHKRTRNAAESGVSEMAARATDTWDKLEQVFENRVAAALNSLGVPTRKELDALAERVDALAKAVEKLGPLTAPKTVKSAIAPKTAGKTALRTKKS